MAREFDENSVIGIDAVDQPGNTDEKQSVLVNVPPGNPDVNSAYGSSMNNVKKDIKDKNKIIVVGDSQCRDASGILYDYVRQDYDIQTFVRPGAKLDDIIDVLQDLSHTLNKKDFVIVVAGTNDILSQYNLNKRSILQIKKVLENTNGFIVNVPYFNKNSPYNKFICNFNAKLYSYINELNCPNIKLIDTNSIIPYSDISHYDIHLIKAEKRRIFHYISKMLCNGSVSNEVAIRMNNLNSCGAVSVDDVGLAAVVSTAQPAEYTPCLQDSILDVFPDCTGGPEPERSKQNTKNCF